MNVHDTSVTEDLCSTQCSTQCSVESNTIACPACGIDFTPMRSNQRYCSRCCQSHASRGSRERENLQRSAYESERAQRLKEMLYTVPPRERLGVMRDILSYIPSDGSLRNILTRPEFLSDAPFSNGRGQMNIAKAADAYAKKFFGVSIRTYVRMARKGETPMPVEIIHSCDAPAVPNLRRKLTREDVKCWHKPLKSTPRGDTERFTIRPTREDFERVNAIVIETQQKVDAA